MSMKLRHFLILMAVLLLFSIILVGADRAAQWVDSPSNYPEFRESYEEASERLPNATKSQVLKTELFHRPCSDDQGREASSLCSQWRSVDAAQRSARWSWWQMFFSASAVIGLIGTLYFNLEAWRNARDSQSDTARALKHAEESANSMASVAQALHKQFGLLEINTNTNHSIANTQKQVAILQLRAYISVNIGGAVYQDSKRSLRFEAKPVMLNSGHTPARGIKFRIKSDILPVPLPSDFTFDDPLETSGDGFLPPHQSVVMSALMDRLINDADVEDVMRNHGQALYVWGDVSYTDAFEQNHNTKFCHRVIWIYDDKNEPYQVNGYYMPGGNSAT